MRQYLVGGFVQYAGTSRPIKGTALLEDDEVMDAQTLAKVEALLLRENNSTGTIATRVAITTFQPFEEQGSWEEEIHLNECSVILPPVDSPLLIEVAPGVVRRATRVKHAQQRDDSLEFFFEDGARYIGRPRWTHP
jgi:hypothetical protein